MINYYVFSLENTKSDRQKQEAAVRILFSAMMVPEHRNSLANPEYPTLMATVSGYTPRAKSTPSGSASRAKLAASTTPGSRIKVWGYGVITRNVEYNSGVLHFQ